MDALPSPTLERSTAREVLNDNSLHYISVSLLKECSSRCHRVDLISALTAAEAASGNQESIKSIITPVIKYLTRPLMAAQYRWFEA